VSDKQTTVSRRQPLYRAAVAAALTLVAMLLVTLFVLRLPLRLLAVPLAALAAYWTAGAAGLARLPITPATMAVLPVVLGLATDYTLQCVNRLADEESGGPTGRVVRAVRAILPPTGIAAAATIAGVLAFAFSPLPLLRQFAFFLAIGVVMAYLAAFLVGAYQETLGDLHNLFGDTHVVHIRLHDEGGWWIEEIVKGDTANKVLEYMEYDVAELAPALSRDCERAIRDGRMTIAESQKLKRFYEGELDGFAL